MQKLLAAVTLVLLVCGIDQATSALAAPTIPVVSGLYSPSHPSPAHWYAQRRVSFAWAALPGVAGYSYVFDQNPTTVPGATLDPTTAPGLAPRIGYAAGPNPRAIALATSTATARRPGRGQWGCQHRQRAPQRWQRRLLAPRPTTRSVVTPMP